MRRRCRWLWGRRRRGGQAPGRCAAAALQKFRLNAIEEALQLCDREALQLADQRLPKPLKEREPLGSGAAEASPLLVEGEGGGAGKGGHLQPDEVAHPPTL